MPAFANASGKYYLHASSWPYNYYKKTLTNHLFHHHGDAFSTVFTQVPQNLVVTHDSSLTSGVEFFNVMADAGSLVGLCIDGVLFSSVISDGGVHTFNIPAQMVGSHLVVTVTKQNHLRYRNVVPVLPAAGCFVIYHDLEINDSMGNNNGVWDFTEEVGLSINLHNVGLETAGEVLAVISSDDPMVTILDDTAFYGEIPAGEMLIVNDGFRVLLAAEVAHGHEVAFSLVATSGDSSQTSSFTIEAHGPKLEITGFALVGDDDGDGVLDPGESGSLQVALSNQGTNAVTNLSVGLA